MTVCAAAICTVGDKTIGGWKYAIIGVSDRMFTANNIETEPRDQTKIHYLGRKVVALGAGDVGINYAVTEVTRHQVKESAVVDVPSIASWQAKNYADYRQKHLECRYLADYGLTMDSFIARQQEFVPELATRIADKMARENLDVESIVCGLDDNGAHVFRVVDFEKEYCCTAAGFCAVGNGSKQFDAQFRAAAFASSWRMPETLLLLYSAKMQSEASPGIGKATDIFVIDDKGFRLLSLEAIGALEEHYAAMEKANKKAWTAAVAKLGSRAEIQDCFSGKNGTD